ncbi:GNAT family protein [Pelagicoccus sp. SDUM812003]|uniref:GNAT family N-acetyltransferase n=1 Tax=Pelagicoccus sp. SDUM812003 TaxID=3041267 RepID=UPI00280EF3DB|nr:GNAT family protein [Pelagicoccus sp. SDUM812003]MDQ8203168.1 GNAT family protein [Pelagicoccus sp. SDUM812003]
MKPLSLDTRLETDRLILRCPLLEDIDFIFDATRYPSFNDGMLWDPPEAKEACVETFHKTIENWNAGTAYVFTMELKENGTPVGRIAIEERPCGDSVGFWTHPKYQNYGYMSEALQRLLDFCFTELGLKVIEACHADWNFASRRVLEKNGFRFKRHLEEGFMKRGEWVAEDQLSITQSQWRSFLAQDRGLAS